MYRAVGKIKYQGEFVGYLCVDDMGMLSRHALGTVKSMCEMGSNGITNVKWVGDKLKVDGVSETDLPVFGIDGKGVGTNAYTVLGVHKSGDDRFFKLLFPDGSSKWVSSATISEMVTRRVKFSNAKKRGFGLVSKAGQFIYF